MVDGKERVVGYWRKVLDPAERNYSTVERECLAMLKMMERYRHLLLGRHFTARTDQASLVFLGMKTSKKIVSRRIKRWNLRLDEFRPFDVEHIPGKQNTLADMLSRLESENPAQVPPTLPDDDDSIIIAGMELSSLTVEDIRRETLSDPVLQDVAKYMKTHWPDKSALNGDQKRFFRERNCLSEKDGLLFYGDRLIIPKSCRHRILTMLHSGHPGMARMIELYTDAYMWPGATERVKEFTKSCIDCSRAGKNAITTNPPINNIPRPTEPWKKVGIDICGPFATAPQQHQHIVVLIDYFSGFPELLFTDKTDSRKITIWLEEIFRRFGLPMEMVSDNGPQFTSEFFEDWLKERSIVHTTSALYNPQENGKVERFNRNLKSAAQVNSIQSAIPFKEAIMKMVEMFRSTSPNDGQSPGELMFGRKIRTRADIRNPSIYQLGGGDRKNAKTKTQDLRSHPASVGNKGPIGRQPEADKYIADYENANRKRSKQNPFLLGDFVTTTKPGDSYLKGESSRREPLQIVEKWGIWTYGLSDGSRWNIRKLKRYNPTPSLYQEDYEPFTGMDQEEDANPPGEIIIRRSSRPPKETERYGNYKASVRGHGRPR